MYFLGLRSKGTADTEFGGAVHKTLEDWGTETVAGGRIEPDLGTPVEAVAAEALPYVRTLWVPGCEIEGAVTVRGRFGWTGRLDLVPGPGEVIDYKTTSDFKWVKDLAIDPQAHVYAHDQCVKHPGLESVKLTWLYLLKRKPYRALPVVYEMGRAECARGFSALEMHSEEMQSEANKCAESLDPREYVTNMEPSWGHCKAFRGCPHRETCNPPFFAPDNEPKKNFLDILKTRTPMATKNYSELNPFQRQIYDQFHMLLDNDGNPVEVVKDVAPDVAPVVAPVVVPVVVSCQR